ncbi:MAG: WD40 repeat domain-containing protein, partial [Myxococcota bacterium]
RVFATSAAGADHSVPGLPTPRIDRSDIPRMVEVHGGRLSRPAAGDRTSVDLWHADSGEPLARLTMPPTRAAVQSLDFSPDGSMVALVLRDRVWIWRTRDGTAMSLQPPGWPIPHSGILHGPDETTRDGYRVAAFMPDNRRFVTAGPDGTARIWDAHDGRELDVLRTLDPAVPADSHEAGFDEDGGEVHQPIPAVSADGERVAVERAGVVRSWRTADLSRPPSEVSCAPCKDSRLGFFARGHLLALSPAYGEARMLVDVDFGTSWPISGHGDVVAFSANGSIQAKAQGLSTVEFLDVRAGEIDIDFALGERDTPAFPVDADGNRLTRVRLAPITDQGTIERISLSPGGDRLVTSGDHVRIWNTTTAKELASLDHFGDARVFAWSADGNSLVVGSYAAALWGFRRPEPLATTRRGASSGQEEWPAVVSSDGERFAVADGLGISIWSTHPEATDATNITGVGGATNMSFSPDGTQLLVATGAGATLHAAAEGTLLGHVPAPNARFVGTSGLVASFTHAPVDDNASDFTVLGTMRLWDPRELEAAAPVVEVDGCIDAADSGSDLVVVASPDALHLFRLAGDAAPTRIAADILGGVRGLALSPAADRVAVHGLNAAGLFDLGGTEAPRLIAAHGPLTWSPDGSKVAGNGPLGPTVWDPASGVPLRHLKTESGSDDSPKAFSFSADGSRLAFARGRHAEVWYVADEHRMVTFRRHGGDIAQLVFAPGGRALVVVTSDAVATRWPLPEAAVALAEACARLGDFDLPRKDRAVCD